LDIGAGSSYGSRRSARGGSGAGLGHIENVELAASGGLLGGRLGRVVADVVAVHDIVVPVTLARLEGSCLEAEVALPAAGLAGVLGQRKLAAVVVP